MRGLNLRGFNMKIHEMNKEQVGRVMLAAYRHVSRIDGLLMDAKLTNQERRDLEGERKRQRDIFHFAWCYYN